MKQSLAFYVTLLRKDFTGYCNQRLQEMGLSQGLLFFLIYVGKHPGCAPKEVTEALQQDLGHTSRSLVKLKQGGFLVQETNPGDRRSHILRLTGKGEDAFRASQDLFTQWDEKILEGVDPLERERLIGGLARLSGVSGYFDR